MTVCLVAIHCVVIADSRFLESAVLFVLVLGIEYFDLQLGLELVTIWDLLVANAIVDFLSRP